MKNLLFLLLILVSCVSCEKDINTYEGDSGIDCIFISEFFNPQATLSVSENIPSSAK